MLRFAPLLIPLERRLQSLAVSHFVYCFLGMALTCIFVSFYIVCFTFYWWIIGLYFIFYCLDWKTPSQGGRISPWLRNWSLWRHMSNYFPVSLHKTTDLDPSRNYILGVHPHGVLCVGSFTNFCTNGSGFNRIFPRFTSHLTMLPLWFLVPFYRDYLMCAGLVPSSKESILNIINDERGGRLCCVIPGGAPESLIARPGNVELILKPRIGFIKLAVVTGTSLVPVFSFGDHCLWEQEENPPGSRLRRFQDASQRWLQFAFPLFHGRGIFQYNYGLMPYRKSVHTVVGKPIKVEKNANPSSEELFAVQETYINSLRELFEEHKSKFLEPDCQLIIH